MIVGTAGHIDHGKTSLIRRLTGKDTDRLPEEKRRGISIELGYAYLPTAETDTSGEPDVMGFVDVPGHERFVHTMVSGATGIDYALLVVAADDGPMPQTLEHLEILRLLGVHQGAVVLTKIDAVDQAVGDAAVAAIAAAVADQPASRWPLFPVSSVTGDGIDALRAHLMEKAAAVDRGPADGHFRLAVDRAFTLSGIGTIVTGTAHAGEVRVGDEVCVVVAGTDRRMTARVRSLHAQDRDSRVGRSGQRLALALVGVAIEDVPRGAWINGSELTASSQRFDVLLTASAQHDRILPSGLEVHLHHGALDTLARLYPLEGDRIGRGESCLASIVVPKALSICVGDRIVIRDSQAQATLAGARVLDTTPPSRGKRTPQRLAVLKALDEAPGASALAALVGQGPVVQARWQQAWNLRAERAQQWINEAQLVCAAGMVFDPGHWQAFSDRVVLAVDETHVREPEMPGLELNRGRRVAAPQLEIDAFSELVDRLVSRGQLVRKGAFLARPSHKAELSPPERHLWASLSPLLDASPYNPPRVRDIAKVVNIPEAEIRANLRRVARVGEVTLVALDHFFLTHRVSEMAGIAQELFDQHGAVRAADFRDRIGGGRKVAIQILEFFDRVGFTRRIRDEHVVRRPNPFEVAVMASEDPEGLG